MTRVLRRSVLALLLLGCWGLASQASARVYVVAPGGDDAADGTPRQPLRSIGRAAALAEAGDVVRVAPGRYDERVVVAHEGRPGRPIVFSAEPPGGAVMTGDAGFQPQGWAGDDDIDAASTGGWVTIRGFTFRNIATPYLIRAARGWRVEDCVFQHTGFGVNIRGDDVAVLRTVFEDIEGPNAHALVAVNGKDIQIGDVTIRRVNATRQIAEVPRSAVTKFSHTTRLVVDHLLSEDNVGPGLWLDWDNRDFTIRHSILRDNLGDKAAWEGAGMWLEGNGQANGVVTDNSIMGNSGPGISIMESSAIMIRGNVLSGNENCIELRNLPRDGRRPLGELSIRGNSCGHPRGAAVLAATGVWTPQPGGIAFQDNTYQLAGTAPVFDWQGHQYATLGDVNRMLGFEAAQGGSRQP